jgi:hypothetical protein
VPVTVVTIEPMAEPSRGTQALAMGSYRHDIAYTGALKSAQGHALGSYRHDIAYTGALKSAQKQALGSYRHDVSYTAALKSASVSCMKKECFQFAGVKSLSLTPVFFERLFERGSERGRTKALSVRGVRHD